MSATAELARLVDVRAEAGRRVDQLEREAQHAGQELAQARERLAQFERAGSGRQADRAKLETALTTAEAAANQSVWSTRIDGARRRVRDADVEVAEHVRAHLPELLQALEQEGAEAADRVNQACQDLIEASLARETVAARIGGLLNRLRAPQPGDVSFTKSDQLAREAQTFLAGGGEEPVLVNRQNEPWRALLGASEPLPDREDLPVPA
jgi:hypothetical protein